ncbi:MAG TPA: tRNA lysidine(34) synthetase TilS [Candidatus Saccharimonadales bacterium]|nr:tRNA lysidine(34) synthetase TilS [Candidatus Saccharimonadales bacterium]
MKSALAVKLPTTGRYIVAVSGGLDSVALLHLLVSQPESDLQLRVAHVNHGLRSTAERDERLVRDLARLYGLPIDVAHLELGQASEAEARSKRYDFLFEQAKKYRAKAIITAHHGDDQIETSLLNTLRGSGRIGQAASLNRARVLRPLIDLSKSELRDYAKSRGLVWHEDETNQDRAITRNFLRHEMLAELDQDLSRQHTQLLAEHAKLNAQIDQRLAKLYYQFRVPAGVDLPRAWLAAQSWAELEAFIHFVLIKLAPEREFTRRQIQSLVQLAKIAPAGSQFHASASLMLQIRYDTVAIVLGSEAAAPVLAVSLAPETSQVFGRFRLSFGTQRAPDQSSIDLPLGLYRVRSYQPGDWIKQATGRRKLHDIFIDKKVPRGERLRWPIITDSGGQILWLPKLAVDHQIRPNANAAYNLIAEEV